MSGKVAELIAAARATLAGVPQQHLGRWHTPRVFGIARAAQIVPCGSAWHAGVLLITNNAVLARGTVLRAREPVPRGYAATSQRERAGLAAAAFRGGFAEGDTVHIDWHQIDLDQLQRTGAAEPLAMAGGVPQVRWSATAGYRPLAEYLNEQVELLRTRARG